MSSSGPMNGGCMRRRWRFCATTTDAEDVAQEAMLKALANIRQFRAEARFSTWLIQITVNEALMRRRRERTADDGSDRRPPR